MAAVVISYSLGCVSRGNNQTPTNSRTEEVITFLRPVPAVLNEDTHPVVEANETKIKGKGGEAFEFKRAQFVDKNSGWALTGDALYRTTDGGKTWEELTQKPEDNAHFSG